MDYVQSRGSGDLVTNGSGTLGNNYNFTAFTFTTADAPTGAAGSFVGNADVYYTTYADELMPVDPSKKMMFAFKARQISTSDVAAMYGMLVPYDAYKLMISPLHYMYQPGSLTTLALALNPGDLTVTLTDSTNWYGSAAKPSAPASTHLRSIIWWDYVDTGGKAWPALTYSRGHWLADTWNDGALVGNVITLKAPWAGPAKAAGTELSNGSSGGSYMYGGAVNTLVPKVWTAFSATVVGLMTTGTSASFALGWPPGVGYAKIGFLLNSNVATSSRQAIAAISFSDAAAANAAAVFALGRGNHTGTQLAATVSDFTAAAGAAGLAANSTALSTEDLDTKTIPGKYHQPSTANATTARHYPTTCAGLLEVSSGYTYQRYTTYNGGLDRVFVRGYYSTSWGAWSELAKTGHTHAPNELAPGRLGPKAATITDWNDAVESGWYMASNATNAPTASTWYLGTIESHDSSVGNRWVTQTVHGFSDLDGSTDTMTYRRSCNAGVWQAWYKLSLARGEQDARYVQQAPTVITDWNTAVSTGWYRGSSALNDPLGGTGSYIGDVVASSVSYCTQTVHEYTTDGSSDSKVFRRSMNGTGIWSAWWKVLMTRDELDLRYAQLASPTFTGNVIVPTPTATAHAVTKGYADGLVMSGPTGAQGIQGAVGSAGADGADSTVAGPQGIQGITGTTGTTGSQGIQGEIGYTGALGPQGIQGVAGNTGNTGPAGVVAATLPVTFSAGTVAVTVGTTVNTVAAGNDARFDAINIVAGTNLNTLTATGTYTQTSDANATAALNYPVPGACGILEVTAGYTYQRFTTYKVGGNRVFVRGYFSATWAPWSELNQEGHIHDDLTGIALPLITGLDMREKKVFTICAMADSTWGGGTENFGPPAELDGVNKTGSLEGFELGIKSALNLIWPERPARVRRINRVTQAWEAWEPLQTGQLTAGELDLTGYAMDVSNSAWGGSRADTSVTNIDLLFPVRPDLVMINHGHNYDSTWTPATYLADIQAFVDALNTKYPPLTVGGPLIPVAIASQNPSFLGTAGGSIEKPWHLPRMMAIRNYAAKMGWGYIPMYEAFNGLGDGGHSLIRTLDGVHPNWLVASGVPVPGGQLQGQVVREWFETQTRRRDRPVPVQDSGGVSTDSAATVQIPVSGGASGSFLAPTSGRVMVHLTMLLKSGTAGTYANGGVLIKDAYVVGSGTTVVIPNSANIVSNTTTSWLKLGGSILVEGLKPGCWYNFQHSIYSGTNTVTVSGSTGQVMVVPAP